MSDSYTLTLKSESETESLGATIGALLEPGIVIGLTGTLGSGKTRLTQAIARSLDIKEAVVSPTYTICIPYQGRLKLIHMDAYRIEQPEEVDELDLFESVADGCVLIIEWVDRVRNLVPEIDLLINLIPENRELRILQATSFSDAGKRLIASIDAR